MIVNVSLGDSEFFLNPQLHWKSVSVPSSLSFHLETLHCFIPVECILYGASQDMVYTWMTIGGRRSLEKHELRASVTLIYCLMKHVITIPSLKYLLVHLSQIQSIVFGKFLSHFLYCFIDIIILGRKDNKNM